MSEVPTKMIELQVFCHFYDTSSTIVFFVVWKYDVIVCKVARFST